jgi:iron complex outermembrane receptor protein
VVPEEEVQEKIMMTPGDVSMLLAETNGLRVQTTSPSLGGASVRIQGMRGRYTQVLADGLPLYGGQTGSIGILHIPPMDLRQVEVIKGVASALYGPSAIGGVVNLVSRRPPTEGLEREVLVNATSHGGTDSVLWLAAPMNEQWGVTVLGGAHFQPRSDLDADDWTDLPTYRRFVARPRLFWENGRGGSLLVATGVMTERRRGGTMPGAAAPDGRPFAEELETDRLEAGVVARAVVGDERVLAVRGSATAQRHRHLFGDLVERDRHRTWFGEVSLSGTTGRHTWVAGAALQQDGYRSTDVPRFDETFTVPGVFVQDDYAPAGWLTLSAGARVDVHGGAGAFISPRASALVRADGPWQARVSAGRGYFPPTPFTEETEAIGLSAVAPLGGLEAERASSAAVDVTWAREPMEVTVTVFASRIRHALQAVESREPPYALALVNAPGSTRTQGTELIARYHDEGRLDVIVTTMALWSTEPDPEAGDGSTRRDVPLNPRYTASLDILWEAGPARVGIELFYTGRQALEDNPYRARGRGHLLWGGLVDLGLADRVRAFANIENMGDVRQTRDDPLVRPSRSPEGRWTVDAWAPLEGRTVNAGLRWRF